VEQNRESLIFNKKVSSIREELRMLREQGIINEGTYMDFCFLTSNATSFDQLDQLAQDLAEISQGMVPAKEGE
jgi:ribosomal protein L19E